MNGTNVWYLNEPERKDFLIDNFKPDHLENTVFAIVLDSTKPWQFLDQLSIWSDVIFEINKKLFLQLPVAKQNKMKKNIENEFKFYVDPSKSKYEDDKEENEEGEGNQEEMKEALDLMELDDGILNVNLGVPLLVLWTKSEVIAAGESMKYYSPRFEFIMKNLREFTLRYGGSLIFTSAKKGTNMDVLNSYLNYKYFDADFKEGPEINNKEGIFIPCGYDSPKLVQQLCPSIDDPYDKIVSNIVGSGEIDQQEIQWDDWKDWLDELSKNENLQDRDNDNVAGDSSRASDSNTSRPSTKVNAKSFFEKLKGNSAKNKGLPLGGNAGPSEEEKKQEKDIKKPLEIEI